MGNDRTGGVDLGDRRRTIRLCEFLDRASQNYQSSIAQLSDNTHTSKAYYRLLDNDHVDKNIILEEHVKAVQHRAAEHPTVLCIQDTTELDYSTKPSIKGLGRLNYEARLGMYIHPTLMVTPQGVPLGITDLWSWARKPKNEPDIIESARWKEGYERVCELAQDNPKTRYIYVADREGDLLDIIDLSEKLGHPADYLLRAKHSRLLEDGSKLFDITTEQHQLGQISFNAPRGRGKAARTVHQTIYTRSVRLKSGHQVSILIAKELNPPVGSQSITWRLITNRGITSLEQASELIDWYRKRWLIETLFNILKTGCRIEDRQLGKIERLERLFLMYLMISYRILMMTMLVRLEPSQSCELLFSRDEWQVAYTIRYRKKPPTKPLSLHDMVLIVSGFGGHLGRKGDGDAGAKTIWQGLLKLYDYTYSVNIVNQVN